MAITDELKALEKAKKHAKQLGKELKKLKYNKDTIKKVDSVVKNINDCIERRKEVFKNINIVKHDNNPDEFKPDSSSDISYIEDANFSDVKFKGGEAVKLESEIFPVKGTYSKSGVYEAKVLIESNKCFILKKGALLCKSNNRSINTITNSKNIYTREMLIETKCAKEVKNGNTNKIKTLIELVFDSEKDIIEFILGRKIRETDEKNIKIGNVTLDYYLKTGSKEYL